MKTKINPLLIATILCILICVLLSCSYKRNASAVSPASDFSPTEWDSYRTSYATYTGSGYSGGNALLDPIPADMEITALNPYDYNFNGINAAMAGAYLEVITAKASTIVYVTDLYPEGANGALDLCPISFDKIGAMANGKIDISWHVVASPASGNCVYRIKEGSSQYWAAIQVRNHKYPVIKMEYLSDSQWISMEKTLYNHFIGTNMGAGSITIKITDIRGISIQDSIPPLPDGSSDAYLINGNVQFPE